MKWQADDSEDFTVFDSLVYWTIENYLPGVFSTRAVANVMRSRVDYSDYGVTEQDITGQKVSCSILRLYNAGLLISVDMESSRRKRYRKHSNPAGFRHKPEAIAVSHKAGELI